MVYEVKDKELFKVDNKKTEKKKKKGNDHHYVMTIKNDGRDNFLVVPIYTHEDGNKEKILKNHNCLQISDGKHAKFDKQSQLYAKIRDKRYHSNKNFKPNILRESDYHIDFMQVNEIENFLYDNKNENIAKENRRLKERWRERRKNKQKKES